MTPTTTPMAAWLESAWLARYLDRQLSGDEAAWFEAYLLDKPELLRMVEVDNALRDGLATESATWRSDSGVVRHGEADGSAAEPVAAISVEASVSKQIPKQSSSSNAIKRLVIPTALAASLVMGLGIGWMSQRALVPLHEVESLITNPTRVVFDTMRGVPTAPEVEHAEVRSPYVLVEVAVPPGAKAVTLDVGDPTRAALSPSADGFVSFLISRTDYVPTKTMVIRYSLGGNEKTRTIPMSPLPMEATQ